MFESFGKKLSRTGIDAVQKTKNLADSAKFHGLVSETEKEIQNQFLALGKIYYQSNCHQPPSEFSDFIGTINQLYKQLADYQEQIKQLKGVVICPGCAKEVGIDSTYCNNCGYKLPVVKQLTKAKLHCHACGRELVKGKAFCTGCGAAIEQLLAASDKITGVCHHCGGEADPEMGFCTQCGTMQ